MFFYKLNHKIIDGKWLPGYQDCLDSLLESMIFRARGISGWIGVSEHTSSLLRAAAGAFSLQTQEKKEPERNWIEVVV